MDVPLVVPDVLVASLVVKPVEEVGPDLLETRGRDDVRLPIVLVGDVREYSTVDVSWNVTLNSLLLFRMIKDHGLFKVKDSKGKE